MVICSICKEDKKEAFPLEKLDSALKEIYSKGSANNKSNHKIICSDCTSNLRIEYLKELLEIEKKDLLKNETTIMRNLKKQDSISHNKDIELLSNFTFGDKVADKIALFGGSWYFIISFMIIVVIWMMVNSFFLLTRPFDPYPYILLNLVLSCLSAIQAPLILMSQNRAAIRDRLQAKNDYITNLKAELEIKFLNAKLEKLIKLDSVAEY